MKPLTLKIHIGLTALLMTLAVPGMGHAQLKAGQAAPLFMLKDTQGDSFELVGMRDQPMVIIYFFDVNSRPSQEGLLHLDELAKTYKDSDLVVWGVTRSDKSEVSRFLSRSKLSFPVLIDSGKVSEVYAARIVLPTVCIIGPDLKLLDYFQGGGKTTEKMLVTLAEHQLQRRNTEVAKAISDQVARKDPQNVHARTVKGYAQLKEGDLEAAEKTFYSLSRAKGKGEVEGKEGLSQVYAHKGQPNKAMQMADEVQNKAGRRAFTHVVKGDLLYSRNKAREAEAEYRKAVEKPGGPPAHRAVAYNQLGRIYALKGKYHQSRKMYEQAVALDPFYIEATSNKGMTYERQGEWAKALEAYRRAQTIDRNDPFAPMLAAHAQKMMLLESDSEKRKAFNTQIDTYVKRYKEKTANPAANGQDPWTSGSIVLALTEPAETGGLAMRDGFGRVLTLKLADQLQASGRVQVIEPIVVERVIKRLGLTRNHMDDIDIVVRLAQAFGADLLGKGRLFHLSEGTMLNLKIMDIHSAKPPHEINRKFASAVTLKKDLHWLNRKILTTIMTHYPMKAYVVEVTGNQVLMNLGARQGVVVGALFDVIEEKPPVDYKGKQFQPEPAVMATVEVVKVDSDFAYAHIKEQRRKVHVDDKLRESLSQMALENKVW
jgi:tetratricopeptide (TPR) repeat protein